MINNDSILYKTESYNIVGACFEVYKELGTGFLESVYQECLEHEFKTRNIPFLAQPLLELSYKGLTLKQVYRPDFICYNEIIIELKAVSVLLDEHKSQVLNYLKATKLRLGLLINFGHHKLLEYERLVR
jgi:GxxExxY protein